MPVTKSVARRRFLLCAGGATAAGGAWLGLSQSFPARFIRERMAEVSAKIAPASGKPTPDQWKDSQLTAAWLGHSTILINFYGLNILTDPVLQSRCGANLGVGIVGPKRLIAPALLVDELPRIDLVLLSHAHMDHMDSSTLGKLKAGPQAVMAHRTGDILDGTNLTQRTELKWGDKTVVKTAQHGDIEVEAFEVNHWGARWRRDTYRGYNGYILRRGGKQIIFGGDTAMTDKFAALKSKGPFELACMPIGAYDPWIRAHCTPEQAVRMANDAGAKHIMPIHHSTFRLSRENANEPLERFEAALSGEAERIALRRTGETFATG